MANLSRVIGAIVLFRVCMEAPYASYLWGPGGIGRGSTIPLFGSTLGSALDYLFFLRYGAHAILMLLGLGGLGMLTGIRTRLATLIVFVTYAALDLRVPGISDGGDNIVGLTLVYLLLLLPSGQDAPAGSLRVWFHNLGVLAIGAQLMILYGTSGLMKASGDRWHHGTALYLVSQTEWFSLPSTRGLFHNPWVTTIGSYATVLYQVWFPVAILSRLRPIWLLAGIGFHISIAWTMGLITFSSAMIALDLALITDEEYVTSVRWLRRFVSRSFDIPPPLHVFFDGQCPRCTKIAERWRKSDSSNLLHLLSFREGAHRPFGIGDSEVAMRMVAVDTSGRKYFGFDAWSEVMRRFPSRRWWRPIGWLGRITTMGPRVYDWMSARRVIVPAARCGDVCTPPPDEGRR